MKLDYFDLLSPNPILLPGAGSVRSPKLRDISAIGYQKYLYYLSVLALEPNMLFSDVNFIALLQDALKFFIVEELSPDTNLGEILTMDEEGIQVGVITRENYPELLDLIYQRIHMRLQQPEDLSNAKNKKALEIMEKLQKGRAQKSAQAKPDENLELANIISAVANKSHSLNMANIWDLTVFQLWDCFYRLTYNSIYDIQSMAVAAWGNKDNHFDADAWYKKYETGH